MASACLAGELFARSQMERIGGDYAFKEMSRKCSVKIPGPCFRLTFEAVQKTGRFDVLILESDHVNAAIRPGDKMRLSAEIALDRGSWAEVSQVVLFQDGETGKASATPMWLMSRKHKAGPGPAARYIEMHVPQNDYLVL